MKGDQIRARVRKGVDIVERMGDHQMHVKQKARPGAQRADNGGADCNIGYKVPVHHINMQHIRAGLLHTAHFLRKLRKISG